MLFGLYDTETLPNDASAAAQAPSLDTLHAAIERMTREFAPTEATAPTRSSSSSSSATSTTASANVNARRAVASSQLPASLVDAGAALIAIGASLQRFAATDRDASARRQCRDAFLGVFL
jgi:hypothetical protein